MRLILTLSAALLLQGCASKQAIVTIPPARCAEFVPKGWAKGVEAAPIPDNAPVDEWMGKPLTPAIAAIIIAPWAAGYVAMSGQLEKANGRTADAMEIPRQCEAMVNEARPENR